ncbi:O-antigen ligase family protein [Geodermatophilus sp. URMC 64]
MRPGFAPGRPGQLLVAFLLVAGTVGWRRAQYFSGSLDPVVVAKGGLSAVALLIAFLAAQAGTRRALGTGSLWVLATLLGGSVFGALTHGTPAAGGLVGVRVAVLALTVFFLLRTATVHEAFSALALACGTVGLVAAVTGVSTLASGRLAGGVPPLSPNELALLAGVVVLYVAWRTVLGEAGWLRTGAAVAALGVIWVTGSRTGLLMLVVAVVVMALHIRRARVGLVVGALVVAAVGAVAVLTTGVLTSFAERDGTGTSTLDSRFIAWRAAASWAETGWQLVFGGGLSVKIIEVKGQWWNEQPLDSSWVSLLVQAGLLGLLVAIGWVLWVVRGALRAPHPHRVLFLGVVVFVTGRSLLESGLFDATPAFLAFFAVSLLAEGGSRARLGDELRPAPEAPHRPLEPAGR